MDTDTDDITSNGFGNTLTRDGQGSATANLPMNSFRHTGAGNGVARTDYATMGQLEDGGINWGVDSGAADLLAVSYAPPITTLVDGQLCFVRALHANATTTPTFSPNGLTAHTITKDGGAAVAVGDIPGALAEIALRYNLANTRWELLTTPLAQLAASSLLGNPTGGTLTPGAVSLGAGLAFNGSALAISLVSPPQGRLTLTTLTPVLATDASAQSTVYYTPYIGNTLPIYNGSSFAVTAFTELSMVMSGANFASGAIYDFFVVNDSGTIRLGIGPVWSTLTAGSGSRGTGAGTTEIQRLNGIWTNKNIMTLRYAAGSTVSIPVNQATYVGSMQMDSTNSQVSCFLSYGQSRKWGIWNAYNRVPIIMQGGDGTASWLYNAATWRESNGGATNFISTFTGLPEELVQARFIQTLQLQDNNNTSKANIGIGYNSTTVPSGRVGVSENGFAVVGGFTTQNDAVAEYTAPPLIGINNINALENGNSSAAATFFGATASMLLTTNYRG